MPLDVLVVKSIMSPRKIDPLMVKEWTYLNNLQLADSEYFNPNNIDLLFGVDIEGIIAIDGLKKGQIHEPL